ncbi:UMP-CMP kinase 2, mitochondrial [Taeniopygia guttata]|uniref:UMP-CMP kinase 2, mitochondrial n=1 Tax=Taeniopygia guttata TaxID=59729 RepID=UPI003BB962F8
MPDSPVLLGHYQQDSATRARGNVTLCCWRTGRPDSEARTWDVSRDCWRPSAHRPVPRGTEPVQPGARDAGRGGHRGVPRSFPLLRAHRRFPGRPGQVSFPAGSSSASARSLRSAAGPSRCSRLPSRCSRFPARCSRFPARFSRLAAPGSLLPARCSRLAAPGSRLVAPGSLLPTPGSLLPVPGSLLLARCSRLPAMLGRCAPGSPCPRPVARALPPSASALRQRLRQCAERIPEAEAVLDLLEKCPEHQKKGSFPVIVFEGLDATGKTTVTQAVKDALNGILLRSPPACISQWRTVFDDEPTPIKRAFYAAGNYILASEIAKASTQAPVIIDRYWHSTAAYAIATETSGKVQDLPPAQDEVYQWPEDLLKPDLVLLLTVDPEERVRRLQHRGLEKTKEEAELEANSLFRQSVEESYKRMVNPVCQEVDASPSKEEVLKTVLQLIKKHCAF